MTASDFTGNYSGSPRKHTPGNLSLLTLGAHAQRGLRYLVCVSVGRSVCLSVCLSVYICSRTTGYETAHEQY